jgi:hypothetical protein
MDEQECSPLNLLLKHRELEIDIPTPVRQFIALDVVGYLHNLCLPDDLRVRDTLMSHTPDSVKLPATDKAWVQLSLYVATPFQTINPHRVRDMRPADRRRIGTPCLDLDLLIAALADALLSFEGKIARYRRNIPDTTGQTMRRGLRAVTIAEDLFIDLRDHNCLPASLKAEKLHTKTVQRAFAVVKTVFQSLTPEAVTDRLQVFQQRDANKYYNELLATMRNAFKRHGPPQGYSAQAVHYALAAILSSLLRVSDLPLHFNCTTPGAIQQRLKRSQSD